MVSDSLMALTADIRSFVPSAMNSRAARDEKPTHDTARKARYILSWLTTRTVDVETGSHDGSVGGEGGRGVEATVGF